MINCNAKSIKFELFLANRGIFHINQLEVVEFQLEKCKLQPQLCEPQTAVKLKSPVATREPFNLAPSPLTLSENYRSIYDSVIRTSNAKKNPRLIAELS